MVCDRRQSRYPHLSDPARLAQVIVEVTGHGHSPLRFATGYDAMRAKTERWQDLLRTIDAASPNA
jgi:hypothetical protein